MMSFTLEATLETDVVPCVVEVARRREAAMLELYHHGTSVCAAKVRLALAEKGLEWTGHYVDILAGEQFEPEFLAVNPKAVVPVLVDAGRIVPESTVICEYLEDRFPEPPLYPGDAYQRSRIRRWAKAVDEELHPACSALTYIVSHRRTILRKGAGSFEEFLAQGGAEGAAARRLKWQYIQQGLAAPGAGEKIRLYVAFLDKMETALGASEWLAGERFTMADVAMAPYLERLAMLSMQALWEDGRRPRLEQWLARIRARPAFDKAVRSWVPEALREEMRANGARSWPEVEALLERS